MEESIKEWSKISAIDVQNLISSMLRRTTAEVFLNFWSVVYVLYGIAVFAKVDGKFK